MDAHAYLQTCRFRRKFPATERFDIQIPGELASTSRLAEVVSSSSATAAAAALSRIEVIRHSRCVRPGCPKHPT